jgi:hypothetical protein
MSKKLFTKEGAGGVAQDADLSLSPSIKNKKKKKSSQGKDFS